MDPALMLAAFTTSILAGTGIGGGGLLVIYLTAVLGYGQSDAQAVNLVFFLAASCAALPYHIRKRQLNVRAILLCALFGCIGTLIGGTLRRSLSEESVRKVFGIMLFLVGTRSLFSKKQRKNTTYAPPDGK